MGIVLPSQTAARACVAKLASQKEEQIQELLRDKKIFLIVDEAEIAKQKYISVLVGSLDAPNQTFLVDCHPLDSGSNVNSSIILHTMDDILRQLEIKRKNFLLFLTGAARYMSLAGKTLKELYPSLMHVTCVAHLLHNCTMRMRAHFKNIDEIVVITYLTSHYFIKSSHAHNGRRQRVNFIYAHFSSVIPKCSRITVAKAVKFETKFNHN